MLTMYREAPSVSVNRAPYRSPSQPEGGPNIPDTTHCSENANRMSPSLHPKTWEMMGTRAGNDMRKDDDTSRINAVMNTITHA